MEGRWPVARTRCGKAGSGLRAGTRLSQALQHVRANARQDRDKSRMRESRMSGSVRGDGASRTPTSTPPTRLSSFLPSRRSFPSGPFPLRAQRRMPSKRKVDAGRRAQRQFETELDNRARSSNDYDLRIVLIPQVCQLRGVPLTRGRDRHSRSKGR